MINLKDRRLWIGVAIVIVITVIFIINVPSLIIDSSIKGIPCDTREECWNICNDKCEYDLFDRIRYGAPSCIDPPCDLAIGNCEDGKCTGCDCCWGCIE